MTLKTNIQSMKKTLVLIAVFASSLVGLKWFKGTATGAMPGRTAATQDAGRADGTRRGAAPQTNTPGPKPVRAREGIGVVLAAAVGFAEGCVP